MWKYINIAKCLLIYITLINTKDRSINNKCFRYDILWVWRMCGFFIFSSPESKDQVRFSDHNLSVVRRRCRWCRELFIFSFSSPEPHDKFQSNLAQSILGLTWFNFVQMKGLVLFSRGYNYEIAKIHWRNLKILFSRTSRPISTTCKLCTKHALVMRTQVCSNDGPPPALFKGV